MSAMRKPYADCYRMGKLALRLAELRENKYFRVTVYHYFAAFYLHWCEPQIHALPYLERGFEKGQSGINPLASGYCALALATFRFSQGTPLEELEGECQRGLKFLRDTRQPKVHADLRYGVLLPARELRGASINDGEPDAAGYFQGDFRTPSIEIAFHSAAMARNRSGGYNGAIAFSAEEAQRNDYGSESLTALEIGGVMYWAERRARLQYSAFVYDDRDQQVFMNTPSELPGGPRLQLLDNVGRSRIRGLELEMAWRASDPLELRLGLGWLPKAELESFVNAQGVEVRGNRLPLTSEWNANAFIDYRIPAVAGGWLLQLNGSYQSKFHSDQNQNEYTAQSGYALWNARVAYEIGAWTAALWVKNLTDEEYTHLRFDLINFLGLVQDNRGERRQFGAELA